ncbi:MAG: type II secretion system F family protein [Planctomycetota bacterium]|nr:type II secretion system F family protein [Planctomycetota bacterium]MCZ6817233.1 type II secretion system F family protein [Planctomycetota bacterium]
MEIQFLMFLVLTCFFAAACAFAARMRSRTRTEIIFRHLGLIVRQNMPLPLALQFAGRGESGATRRSLVGIGRLVQMGLPLSEALRRAYPQCPGPLLSSVQIGEKTGTLSAALQDINEENARSLSGNAAGATTRWSYVVVTAFAAAVVICAAQYRVAPRLQILVLDYDVVLPASTQDVFVASPFSNESPKTLYGWIIRLFLVGVTVSPAFLLIVGLARLRPRRADRLGWFHLIADAIRWYVWPLNRIASSRACASTARTTRLATAAGWPFHDAVLHAADADLNYFWRGRLRAWSEAMKDGAEPVASGRENGVPEVLLRAVAVGMRDGDLDAPLHHAGQYYSTLTNRWTEALVQVLWPAATLAVAAIVGMYCYAFVAVIASLTNAACAMLG